ncbi:AP-1 complex subunit mu-2 isoform 3-T3 [Morphnus guianensis]
MAASALFILDLKGKVRPPHTHTHTPPPPQRPPGGGGHPIVPPLVLKVSQGQRRSLAVTPRDPGDGVSDFGGGPPPLTPPPRPLLPAAADQPQLQGGRGAGGDRALHGAAAAAGGGGGPHPPPDPRQGPFPLDQTCQPLPGGHHQEERQRFLGLLLPLQGGGGLLRVLQGAGGGEHPRQLRHHLRAPGRADGLWLPADHGQQDPAGVSGAGGARGGVGTPPHPPHPPLHPPTHHRYITQEGNKLETGKSRVPTTVTNAVSWRSEGIKYKKNEVFIDVIESVNLLVSANGSVLLSEVVGTIKLKVFLSGMPELRLGLNDRVLFELTGRGKNKSVELEDVKFHQCVRLSRFDNDRTISFIPPDGDFELMSYRLNTQVKPLIWIESVIEKFSHSRVEIMVKAKGQFKKQSVANGVEIAVPVPSDADSPKFKTSVGSARYLPERNLVIWTIKSFPVRLPTPPIPNAGVPLVGFSPSRLPRRVARHRPQPHGCCAGGKGAPDARPLRSAQRGEGGGGGSAPHLRPLRDSLLHRLGHPGAVHEDHREERVPGAALGALHHPERGLPAPHQLRAGGGAPRTTMDTPPSGHPPRAPPPPLCL